MRLSRPVPLSLLVFCLALSVYAATGSRGYEQPVPNLKIRARAVVVDVVVTNGKNEAVSGLRKQDFQLLEDGKSQSIDYFEEHTAGTRPPGTLPSLPKMPPNVYTNVPSAPRSDAVNVLLLDTLNTDRLDQSYVHSQIVAFLKNMQPGLQVAVFVLGSKLRMVQGFTTDSSVLRSAVDNKANGISMEADSTVTRSLQDKADDLEDKSRMALIDMSPTGLQVLSAVRANTTGYQADQRVAMTLEALNYLGRYLAGIPGRKNLIWFSSSFPITVFPSTNEKQTFAQSRQFSAAMKKTADLLTVSKVAVYPIGAEGMMVEHVADPILNSRGGIDLEGGEVSSRTGPGSSGKGGYMGAYVNEAAARSDKIMAMEQLAADTGGKAFYNTNDLSAAMQHAINNGAHYYTLVYTPSNKKMDGQYRRIEVKTAAAKYQLAYRRGYNADDTIPADPRPNSNPLRPLMTLGAPNSTQLLYGIRVLPAAVQPAPNAAHAGKNRQLTGPVTRYSVDFMIRWTDLHLEAMPDGTHSGKVQVELVAYDRDGRAVNWLGVTQEMRLTPELFAAVQKSGVPAHLEIDLPNTDVFLESGVYDWATAKAGTLEVPLHPAKPETEARRDNAPKSNP